MADSIQGRAGRQRRQEQQEKMPTQLSLEVRQRAELEDPVIVGSLKLKGDMPVKEDLHVGDEVTVQVANADGQVIAIGLFEVGLPNFKDVKVAGAGPIGVERVHAARFLPGE